MHDDPECMPVMNAFDDAVHECTTNYECMTIMNVFDDAMMHDDENRSFYPRNVFDF